MNGRVVKCINNLTPFTFLLLATSILLPGINTDYTFLFSGAKLRIVEALIQQMLTYAATRDMIEDNYEKLRQAKQDLRSFQAQKNIREREEATFWYV